MINRAFAISYKQMKGLIEKTPHIIDEAFLIGIIGGGDRPLFFKREKTAIVLRFDDVDREMVEQDELGGLIIFTEEQADSLIEFLQDIVRSTDLKDLYIHCGAGISRSGAIALFCCRNFGIDEEEFSKDNPVIQPNKHVLDTLNERYRLRKQTDLYR